MDTGHDFVARERRKRKIENFRLHECVQWARRIYYYCLKPGTTGSQHTKFYMRLFATLVRRIIVTYY